MRRDRTATPPACALVLLAAGFSCGCGNSGGDDQGSGLRAAFTGPASTPSSDAVFLRAQPSSGRIVVLDVVGRNVAAPVDGLNVALGFDPTIVEAFGVQDQTFLGTCGTLRPDNTRLICADNVRNGQANVSGTVIFGAHPQGTPSPETISGDRVLATFSFRARAVGSSPLLYYVPLNPAPGTGSVSELTSAADPNAAAGVRFVPDLPGQASIEVERSP